jgi:putative addiction module component (TIGR02574 family)
LNLATDEEVYRAMSQTLKSLGIDHLSASELISLVEEIWDSIPDEGADIPVTEAQKEDLGRRLANYRANSQAGSSWEVIKSRLQDRP